MIRTSSLNSPDEYDYGCSCPRGEPAAGGASFSTDASRSAVPSAITTPATQESGIGTLEFTDGYPTRETAAKLRDHLDYLHGVESFMNTIQGVSTYAIRDGFLNAGISDGDVLIFSELMDSAGLYLTGNADTVYFLDVPQLVRRPNRPGNAFGHPRRPRRHVVPLDHRLRPPGRRPRPGRHLSDRPPGLRRATA
jgi:hypothetical protein